MARPLRTLATMFALATLLLASLAALPAQAQIQNAQAGGFGTQVKVGDADYVPLLKGKFRNVVVAEANFGSGAIADDCVVMLFDGGEGSGNVPVQLKRPGGVVADAVNGATTPAALVAATGAAGGIPASVTLAKRDIRLVTCLGKPAGEAITDNDPAVKLAAFTTVPTATLQYVDMNSNGKYAKGDYVYLTSGVGPGLVPSTGVGAWTIRLTPVAISGQPVLPGGSFVMPTDPDLAAYQTIATNAQPALAGAHPLMMLVAEREDKGWYLVPTSDSTATDIGACTLVGPSMSCSTLQYLVGNIAANLPVPANSIRIGTIPLGTSGTFTLQPSVIPSSVSLANPDAAQAGQPLPILVTLTNAGADAGVGVLMTKLDHQIVDVRITPKLSPNEVTQILVPLRAPAHGGSLELEVNDVVATVSIKGPPAGASSAAAASTGDLSTLQSQIADLQAKVATLQSQGSGSGAVKTQSAPGLAPLALLGSLVVVALVVRRRADE